jgi:2'-5' RNA ligase
MRTFIAIPLPAEARNLLASLQDEMRPLGSDVRWTAVPSIHLTLKFLGEIDAGILPRLAGRLRDTAATHSPFRLHLRGLGAFPELRGPRVIWCGVGGDLPALVRLQEGVEEACVAGGLPAEDRPFRPHLTLGRVRSKRNLPALIDYIKIGSARECAFAVGDFHVYQSILKPAGAVYTVLEKVELRGR